MNNISHTYFVRAHVVMWLGRFE